MKRTQITEKDTTVVMNNGLIGWMFTLTDGRKYEI